MTSTPQLIPVKALTDDDEKQLVTVYYSKEVFSSLRKEAFGSNNLSRFFVLIRTPEDHNHWIQAQDADELVSRRSLYYALDNSVLFKGEGEFVVHARDSSNYVQEIFAHRLDYLIKIFQKQRPFNIKIDNPENALIKKCAGLAIASHLGQKIELVDEYVLGHLFATATKAAEWGVSHHAVCAALLHKMSADQLAKLHQEIDPDDAAKITGLINKLNQLERIPFWYGAKVDSHYVQNAIHIRDQNLADLDDLLLFLSDKLDKTKRMALHQNKKNNLYAWQLISIIIEASLLLATIAGIRDLKKPYEELLDAAFAVFRPQEYRRLKKERDACLHRSPEKLTSYLENIKNIFADPQGEVFWRIKGLFSCYVKLHERKKVFPTVASLPDLIAFTVLRERPFSCPEEVEAFIDRGLESSRRIDIESTKKMRKDERYRTDCHARTYMWHVYVIDKHGRRIEFQVGPPSQYKIMVYGELRHWKRAMEKRMRILLSYLVENKTEHAEKGRLREAKKEARGDLEEMLENQIIDEGYYNALANFLGKNPLVDFTHLRDNSQQYTIVTCLTRDWQFQTKRLLSEFNNKKPTIEDLAATHGIDMLGEDFYEAESGILQMDDEGLFVANYKNVVSGEELVSGRIYRFKSKIENGIENQPLSVEGRAALLSKVQRYRTMVYLLIRKEHVNKLKKIGKPRLVELENEHKLSPQKIMELLNMEEDELCAALSQPMLFDLASKRLAELLARESKNLLN